VNIRTIVAVLLLLASAALLVYVFVPTARLHVGPAPPATDYADRDWSDLQQGELNISLYTFRDRNRNGEYDLGDLPMAAVNVQLNRPDGADRAGQSNINGYANFAMHDQSESAPVSEAGDDYIFKLEVPPGWQVTTGNAYQTIAFRQLEGSISGLVADPPPTVVGLAPDLVVSGGVAGNIPAGASLLAQGPGGERQEPPLDDHGRFQFTAAPGQWQVALRDQAGTLLAQRGFDVTDAPVVLSALQPGHVEPAAKPVSVLQDFEYLRRADIDKIPNGNAGLGWDYLLAVDNQLYRGPGYVNVLTSGRAVAYNSSGHPVTVSGYPAGSRFDFVGAYFAVAWPRAQGELLRVEAWRGGQQVASDEVTLSSSRLPATR